MPAHPERNAARSLGKYESRAKAHRLSSNILSIQNIGCKVNITHNR